MKKREPLLSDEAITDRSKSSYNFDLAWAAIDYGRTFYEHLIDEGKLRVVEEVDYDRGGCKHCGNCDDYGNQWKVWNFCPGCGNKIKR